MLGQSYGDIFIVIFLEIEYLRNETRSSHSCHRTSIGSHMCSIEW